MRDLYEILGVARKATAEQIKAAYRDKAKAAHPDGGGSAGAFAELKHAYEVLGSPEKRASYDRTGDPDPHPERDEAMAIALIADMVLQLVDDLRDYRMDPIKIMAQTLDRNIGHEMGVGERAIRERLKCKDLLHRFKSKGKSRIILTVLERRIVEIENEMLESKRRVNRMKRAKEMVLDHEFKVDDMLEAPATNTVTVDGQPTSFRFFYPKGQG